MKPSWTDAPEWAKYLAMDRDERWYWYDVKPFRQGIVWVNSGRALESDNSNWRDTLEPRPLDTST